MKTLREKLTFATVENSDSRQYEHDVVDACIDVCKEEMKGFAEWADNNGYIQHGRIGIWFNVKGTLAPQKNKFTTLELADLYLNQKDK